MANGKAVTKCLIALLLALGAMPEKLTTQQNEMGNESAPSYAIPVSTDNPQEEVPNVVVDDVKEDVGKMDKKVMCVVLSEVKPQDSEKEEQNFKNMLTDLEIYEAIMITLLLLVMVVEMVLLVRIRSV